jgi:hypothetical protein
MNDFQMSFLASDRNHDLQAEADRQRRARPAPQSQARSRKARPVARYLSLSPLLSRIVFF